ncbi:MAG: dihydroneopterin aldolase [Pseudomonadota bacterium]
MDLSVGVEAAPDLIIIENLRVDAPIGVLESEHGRMQGMRFDVEIETVPGYLDHVGRTGEYVSYADAVEFIQNKAANGTHVRLVEEWAVAVADHVLSNPLVAHVSVRVTKTEIFEAADGVGIRIRRTRD